MLDGIMRTSFTANVVFASARSKRDFDRVEKHRRSQRLEQAFGRTFLYQPPTKRVAPVATDEHDRYRVSSMLYLVE